ncbi:DUF4433 domain-containing protein [Paraferrimonas haliotis]|uniref:DUF4433 domain-containing protein n=1 Tax=Paraferrimonas haliotis TaxID=2013866 RepID=UPI000BA968AF|nr:DUF4433 domain-containing protein [Paraferrimonas haliotis]
MIGKQQIGGLAGVNRVQHLFHMTHIENLPTILTEGLLSHNNPFQKVDVSNRGVNARRTRKDPIYNKPLHSYVPFYFNPRNAMLFSTQKNFGNDMVILGYDSDLLDSAIITDKNAACNSAEYYAGRGSLSHLEWSRVFNRVSWKGDDDLKQAMMAEALLSHRVDTQFLSKIVCCGANTALDIRQRLQLPNHVKLVANESYFFPMGNA